MRTATVGFALCCAVLPLAAQTYTDPGTGLEFPTSLTPPGSDAPQVLTGTGVRTRTMLKVKAYAFGLYVDSAGARGTLASWAGKASTDLQRDEAFYQKLLEQRFPMTLRLVMARDADGDAMAEAFNGVLLPRVTSAAWKGMTGGETALGQFKDFFSNRVAKGTELVFSCSPEGNFVTTIAGERKPDIQSPPLCWALFDVYLGEEPISRDGKKTVVANFPQLLAAGQ